MVSGALRGTTRGSIGRWMQVALFTPEVIRPVPLNGPFKLNRPISSQDFIGPPYHSHSIRHTAASEHPISNARHGCPFNVHISEKVVTLALRACTLLEPGDFGICQNVPASEKVFHSQRSNRY
jgi:hypothetical protein